LFQPKIKLSMAKVRASHLLVKHSGLSLSPPLFIFLLKVPNTRHALMWSASSSRGKYLLILRGVFLVVFFFAQVPVARQAGEIPMVTASRHALRHRLVRSCRDILTKLHKPAICPPRFVQFVLLGYFLVFFFSWFIMFCFDSFSIWVSIFATGEKAKVLWHHCTFLKLALVDFNL
jgi:hypothetical protein